MHSKHTPLSTLSIILSLSVVNVGYDWESYIFSEADGVVNVVVRISKPIANTTTIRPQGGEQIL